MCDFSPENAPNCTVFQLIQMIMNAHRHTQMITIFFYISNFQHVWMEQEKWTFFFQNKSWLSSIYWNFCVLIVSLTFSLYFSCSGGITKVPSTHLLQKSLWFGKYSISMVTVRQRVSIEAIATAGVECTQKCWWFEVNTEISKIFLIFRNN